MEININLFHEKPMFSFRCTKKNKKILKERAKRHQKDLESYLMKASDYYTLHENNGLFCLHDILCNTDNEQTPIKIKLVSDESFEHIIGPYDRKVGFLDKYMMLTVVNLSIENMENVTLGREDVPGLCVTLNDIK